MEEANVLLFEAYLEGTLDSDQQKDFELRLKQDAQFAKDWQAFQEVYHHVAHVHSPEREDFLNTLRDSADTYFSGNTSSTHNSTGKVIKFIPWKYSIAAAVLLLFGVLFWQQIGGDPLYSEYAFEGEISLSERSGAVSAFAKAEKAFNQKEYNEAVSYFNEILKQDTTNSEVMYYKGIALVELDNYTDADAIFNILSKGTSLYKYRAFWYGALSKLKQEDMEACRKLLEKIPSTAQDYEKAQELLKKIDR